MIVGGRTRVGIPPNLVDQRRQQGFVIAELG